MHFQEFESRLSDIGVALMVAGGIAVQDGIWTPLGVKGITGHRVLQEKTEIARLKIVNRMPCFMLETCDATRRLNLERQLQRIKFW
jgi:hypothetical protein